MSFKDNFTREENQDLEFDYSAFWTYASTFIIIFMIPIISKLKNRVFYKPKVVNKKYLNCQCQACKVKLETYKKRKIKENYNLSFYLLLSTLLILFLALSYSTNEVINNKGKIKSFNPHEILEVSEEADEKQIKKAYRLMSLKFHPDRCHDPDCKPKFIMITKAFEALTDPVAMENFKNTGNPDGGYMKIGIALPPFVYNKKNHMPILILFLIFILIVIPASVYMWYNSTQMYDENGIRVDNQKIFYNYLNENVLTRQLPFISGCASEFLSLKINPTEASHLQKLFSQFKERYPKYKENEVSYNQRKAICLIYSCLEQNLPKELEEEAVKVMNKLPDLIMNMYSSAMEWTHMYNQYNHLNQTGMFRFKNMGINCLKSILEFSQNLHQQLPINSSPFMQLPYFKNETVKEITKFNNKKPISFDTLLLLERQTRVDILKNIFNDKEILDIESAIEVFPIFDAKIEAFVDGYSKILPKDIVTVKISLRRLNLKEKDKEIGFPHSSSNIDIYEEKAAILVLIEEKIIYHTIMNMYQYESTYEFKHLVQNAGLYKFKFEVIPFTVKGMDVIKDFSFEVVEKSEEREQFVRSLEEKDNKLKIEPSLFQTMLQSLVPNEENQELDSDDESNETKGKGKVKEE